MAGNTTVLKWNWDFFSIDLSQVTTSITMEWKTWMTRGFEKHLKMCSPPNRWWLRGTFVREIMITLVTHQLRSLKVPDQNAGIFQTSITPSPGRSLLGKSSALYNWPSLWLINFCCLSFQGSDKELQLVLVDTVLLCGITDYDRSLTQPEGIYHLTSLTK